MRTYNAICPICGCVNRNLILEETEGWMECENCKQVTQVMPKEKMVKIPVFSMRETELAVSVCLAQ